MKILFCWFSLPSSSLRVPLPKNKLIKTDSEKYHLVCYSNVILEEDFENVAIDYSGLYYLGWLSVFFFETLNLSSENVRLSLSEESWTFVACK